MIKRRALNRIITVIISTEAFNVSFYCLGDVRPAMTTISNLANRDLDPTTDDEVRSFCKESHFLTLTRTFADRLFSKLNCHDLLKSFLSVQDLSQSLPGNFFCQHFVLHFCVLCFLRIIL